MKYIFPRQFGLHNVFTSQVDNRQTVQPFKDYTLREDEISQSEELKNARQISKVPKRLRGSPFQLVKKLQKRNQSCSFTELLKHYCPIEVCPVWPLANTSSHSCRKQALLNLTRCQQHLIRNHHSSMLPRCHCQLRQDQDPRRHPMPMGNHPVQYPLQNIQRHRNLA